MLALVEAQLSSGPVILNFKMAKLFASIAAAVKTQNGLKSLATAQFNLNINALAPATQDTLIQAHVFVVCAARPAARST